MQEVRRGGLTASAEQTKKQNAQPRMNADLRGYDSLILFKKITKLTKTDAYLWIFVTGSCMPCNFPGASCFSERGSYNGYRRGLEQELKHGRRCPCGSRRPRKRGSAPRFPPITNHVSPLTVSFRSVMFELVDDDGADDDAAFDDLLPVSGNVGQVEDVVQYADNESADDSTCYRADAAGG